MSITQGTSTRGSITTKSDPRNVSDKRFVPTSIRALIDYLTAHSYDHAISPKILTSPSGKDFNNIVQFLFRQIDPNLTCPGKFEDEVISIFKYMKYPYNISKNGLSAVGSPHSWPQLLASIMWVIELLEYDEEAQNDDDNDGDFDDPSSSEKAFFAYLRHAYISFLGGDDNTYAALEEEFIQSYEKKNADIIEQTTALDAENEALMKEIQQVESRRLRLPQLQEKQRDYEEDKVKFENLIEQLQKHKEQSEDKKTSRQAELEKLTASIASTEQDIASLKDTIANQELSPDDVLRMRQERTRLQQSVDAASKASSALQKKVWDAEASLRDKVSSLEEAVRLFNSMAEDLEYVAGAATASATSTPDRKAADLKKKIRIELDIRAKKRAELIHTDIRRDIVPRLQKLKGIITDSSMKLKGDLIIAQDALEECELQSVQLNETKLLLDSKLRRVEESYKKERTALEQHASSHDRDMDTLESKLIGIRDISAEETRALNAKRECGELKTTILADRERHEKNKAEVNQAVMSAAMALADYKEHIQARLGEVKRATEQRLEAVLQLGSGDLPSVPSSVYSVRSRAPQSSIRSVMRNTGAFSCGNSYYIPPEEDEDMSSPVLPASYSGTDAKTLQSSNIRTAFPPPPPAAYDEVCVYVPFLYLHIMEYYNCVLVRICRDWI